MARVCPSCKESYPNSQTICPKCRLLTDFVPSAEVTAPQHSSYGFQSYYHMGVGGHMKWFKFLIYFGMFLYMAVYGIGTLSYLLLAVFSQFGTVSQMLSGTQFVVFLLYGISMLMMAVLTFVARKKLAQFQRNAVRVFLVAWIIQICLNLVFNIALSVFGDINLMLEFGGGQNMFYSFNASASIASIVMGLVLQGAIVYANYVYFNKRSHLSVN